MFSCFLFAYLFYKKKKWRKLKACYTSLLQFFVITVEAFLCQFFFLSILESIMVVYIAKEDLVFWRDKGPGGHIQYVHV